jgi:hypothetical protein
MSHQSKKLPYIVLTLPAKAVVVMGFVPHRVQTLGRSGKHVTYTLEEETIENLWSDTHECDCRKENVHIPSSRIAREYPTEVFQRGHDYW